MFQQENFHDGLFAHNRINWPGILYHSAAIRHWKIKMRILIMAHFVYGITRNG